MASSWAPPAHPTRRSRSRSPGYRGGYAHRPPYPEQGYGDPYRPDWDVYDRERAWANYERDRAAYDYGRRGRSRSPGVDEGERLLYATREFRVLTSRASWTKTATVNVAIRFPV